MGGIRKCGDSRGRRRTHMGIMSRGALITVCLALILTLAAPPVRAQVVSGSGDLFGRGKFGVQRCGRDRDAVTAVVAVNVDGSWSAVVNGRPYSGTSTPIGTSGRKLDLFFDGVGMAQFISTLEELASDLCDESVTSTSETKRKFLLKVNKKRTKAAVILKYIFTGTAGGRSGKARYFFKVKGLWAAAGGN
jgi:hypothetical protein